MAVNKELLKGSTTMLILNLLNKEDMYGYQMTKTLENMSDNTFTLKEGTLYPILHVLENEKMIESYFDDEASLRKRKYYRITKEGQKLLNQKKQEWHLFFTTINKVIGGDVCEQGTIFEYAMRGN